ncbi:UNVERIFIED_CONTAM: hypothetical protein FKN15_055469 [Acipenser sinensis]
MRSNRQPQAMRSWHPWVVVETEAAPDALLQVGVLKAVVMKVKVKVVSPTGILPLLVGLEVEVALAPLLVLVGVVKAVVMKVVKVVKVLKAAGAPPLLAAKAIVGVVKAVVMKVKVGSPTGILPLLVGREVEVAPAPLLVIVGVGKAVVMKVVKVVVQVKVVKVLKAAGAPPLLALLVLVGTAGLSLEGGGSWLENAPPPHR